MLLGNRHFHSKHFVSHSLEVVLMLAPEYEVDATTRNRVIADFTWIHYVSVWLRTLTYLHAHKFCFRSEICHHHWAQRP